jgi:hypothetical protein
MFNKRCRQSWCRLAPARTSWNRLANDSVKHSRQTTDGTVCKGLASDMKSLMFTVLIILEIQEGESSLMVFIALEIHEVDFVL